MSAIETLLKVAQRRLDDVSREAAMAQTRLTELRGQLGTNHEVERSEDRLVETDIALLIGAGAYRLRMRQQRQDIQDLLSEQTQRVEDIRKRQSLAYQEKSKLEKLLERHREREAAERAFLEQKQLDEAGIVLAMRGSSSGAS